MEPGEIGEASGLTRQVVGAVAGACVRESETVRWAAGPDPRLRAQLAVIEGRRLSQVGMAINGLRVQFWGEEAGSVPLEIFIEHPTVGIARPGREAVTCDAVGDVAATALLSALGQRAREITTTGGTLTVVFANALALTVEPDEQYESWQINSDDGLLIICTPGGDLAVWYPPA